jgi:hypothetical protein
MLNNKNNYDIPSYIEECIIQYWLRGYTRDEIAQLFDKSKGTVSNIWAKFRNKLGHYEANALRELGKELRRQNMTAENCAIGLRMSNIMEKLGISEAKTEEFLTTVFELSQKIGIFPEILKEALIEIVKISQTMPISDIPIHLQKMREEIEETENKKKKLEEEIQILEKEKLAKEEQVRSALREKNTTLFHLNNYINTKVKLAKFGIIVEDTDKFIKCAEGIKRYSNFDPFKVIEKFSDLDKLEIEIENKQKQKNDLEIHIEKLKDTESEYDDRLNLKYIKLKNLEELEKIGFSIQDLKKLNMIFIEIAVEHKITNKEQLKAKFFELFEKLEDRIALENTNDSLLKTNLILENKIRINRQILHCQEEVGPILKNLFANGITENQIVRMKALDDILSYNSSNTGGNNIANTNIKYENIGNLSINKNNNNNNNNWRKEYEKVKGSLIINLTLVSVLNAVVFSNIQHVKDRFKNYSCSSFPSTFSYKNSDLDDRKQEGVADAIIADNDIVKDNDSIIEDNDMIYINSCGWSFLTNK